MHVIFIVFLWTSDYFYIILFTRMHLLKNEWTDQINNSKSVACVFHLNYIYIERNLIIWINSNQNKSFCYVLGSFAYNENIWWLTKTKFIKKIKHYFATSFPYKKLLFILRMIFFFFASICISDRQA